MAIRACGRGGCSPQGKEGGRERTKETETGKNLFQGIILEI